MSATPPHERGAERALLGAALIGQAAVDAAEEAGIRPEDFYDPAHGLIYDAITAVAASGATADTVTVENQLRRAGHLDTIGGPGALYALLDAAPSLSGAAKYAAIVADMATLRRVITASRSVATEAGDLPEDVAGFVERAERTILAAADRTTISDTISLDAALDHALAEIEDRIRNGPRRNLPTGIDELDEILLGLCPGQLVVVGARPAIGKSAVAMRIARSISLEQDKPVLFVSLEMSSDDLVQRLLASEANVPLTAILKGSLTREQTTRIAAARTRMRGAKFDLIDNVSAGIATIRGAARRYARRHGGIGCIIVDYVQLMRSMNSRSESRQVEVAEISTGLKHLAREFDCPVVALAQVSRACESRVDKRPMLSDLRESGQLESDADAVLLLFRNVYEADQPDNILEIHVAKQRQGPTGTAKTLFTGATVSVGAERI